jgi:hypothetical protein
MIGSKFSIVGHQSRARVSLVILALLLPAIGPSSPAAAALRKVRITAFDRTQDCQLLVIAGDGVVEDEYTEQVVFQILLSNPRKALVGINGKAVMVQRVSYRGDGRSVRFTFKNTTITVTFNGPGSDNDEDGAFYDGPLKVIAKGRTTVVTGHLRSCN